MGYFYTGIISLAVAILAYLLKQTIKDNRDLKQQKDQQEALRQTALENGVVCLLRVKLIEYHSRYMEEGRISSHGYENWNLMYKAYKALGGNGMVEHMKDEINGLEIR